MSKSATLGPWFSDQYGHIYGQSEPVPIPGFPGGQTIEQPCVCTPKNSGDIALISTAPELLAALEMLMARVDALPLPDSLNLPVGYVHFQNAAIVARAAIKKAKGLS